MAEISFIVSEPETLEFSVGENEKPTQIKSVVPSESAQTVLPDPGFLLEQVDVAAVPWVHPEGEILIAENGEVDVAAYESARVEVPQGVFPSGTLDISSDGTYDVLQYENVRVDTSVKKGLYFAEFDTDGYPHKINIVGIDRIPDRYINGLIPTTSNGIPAATKNIESVEITANALTIGGNAIKVGMATSITIHAQTIQLGTNSMSSNTYLRSVIFDGDVTSIGVDAFNSCNAVVLYDFSKNTTVPSLPSTRTVSHADGCVIKVPSSLLSEWQTANVWKDLIGVVWQGI